jgi:DNA-binding transcriptional ArsR family regulator
VEEDSYRQSRLCRLLGNPVAFAVVELLAENNELNPSEIARAVGRSVRRLSNVLGALRLADVVRYDSDGKRNYYRLKHPGEIRRVLAALSGFVNASTGHARLAALSFARFRNSENMEVPAGGHDDRLLTSSRSHPPALPRTR